LGFVGLTLGPIVRVDIEGAKYFASLRCTRPQVLVEHLFPTRRVEAGGVCYHTVEIKKDGVVLVAGDHPRLRSSSIGGAHLTAVAVELAKTKRRQLFLERSTRPTCIP
jgi:hypothetical protein